jgi:octaprenyl-diphosphate synthase
MSRASPVTEMQTFERLASQPMQDVNRKIELALHSDVALINQMGSYIIGAGGKRLRPKLVLVSALANGYQGEQHINVAAIIEFIHTATLLHDDVVDSSTLRRGRETANAVWGNEAAVLVGDFLYSRSFEMMVEVGRMRIMEILSAATNTIAAGEVMQLLNIGEADVSVDRYLQVIYAKTAKLFEAATRIGAVLADAGEPVEQAMARYGMHLGTAFQLIDDVLDYTADAAELGKNAGDDLAEGKPTLPVIYAMQLGDENTRQALRSALISGANAEAGAPQNLCEIVELVRQTGAIEMTIDLAREHVQGAVAAVKDVPGGPYREALVEIVESSLKRKS